MSANSAAKVKRQRAARRLRLLEDPTLAPHGKASTYFNWGCKCDPCRAAASKERNTLKKKANTWTKEKPGR